MSVKAILEALELLQDECGGVYEVDSVYTNAVREVEAIKAACAFVVRESAITDVENEHVDLIKDIAREAP